jgi:hypothetical protein
MAFHVSFQSYSWNNVSPNPAYLIAMNRAAMAERRAQRRS